MRRALQALAVKGDVSDADAGFLLEPACWPWNFACSGRRASKRGARRARVARNGPRGVPCQPTCTQKPGQEAALVDTILSLYSGGFKGAPDGSRQHATRRIGPECARARFCPWAA